MTGVRIFNWDCKKGGAGIEDLPSILSNAVEATMNNLEAMRIYAAHKINKLTSLMEKILYTEEGMEKVSEEKEQSLVKYGLVNLRQFQAYLAVILQDVLACNSR